MPQTQPLSGKYRTLRLRFAIQMMQLWKFMENDFTQDTSEETDESFTPKETTVREAGRKGGLKVKEKYGQDFYIKIGKMGGRIIADSRGSDYYSDIGKKGGSVVRDKHGNAFFSSIGKKGGEEVKRRNDPDYYSKIGKKGGLAPRRSKNSLRMPDAQEIGAQAARDILENMLADVSPDDK